MYDYRESRQLDFSTPETRAWLARETGRDLREASQTAALIADAKQRGVTGLRCESCGCLHSVNFVNRPCNAMDADGNLCGCWDLEEVH